MLTARAVRGGCTKVRSSGLVICCWIKRQLRDLRGTNDPSLTPPPITQETYDPDTRDIISTRSLQQRDLESRSVVLAIGSGGFARNEEEGRE